MNTQEKTTYSQKIINNYGDKEYSLVEVRDISNDEQDSRSFPDFQFINFNRGDLELLFLGLFKKKPKHKYITDNNTFNPKLFDLINEQMIPISFQYAADTF
jgi:hypothetical protein